MATKVLALTDNGVEMVMPLDQEQVDAVAKWLCENAVHDYKGRSTSEAVLDAYDRQVQHQGYCDDCMHLAGELVAKFDVRERGE